MSGKAGRTGPAEISARRFSRPSEVPDLGTKMGTLEPLIDAELPGRT
jgi:hypothetical protein